MFRHVPRAVVVAGLYAVQQSSTGHTQRIRLQAAPLAVAAQRQAHEAGGNPVRQPEAGRAGRREVAFVGEIRTLLVLDVLDQFGTQKVQV